MNRIVNYRLTMCENVVRFLRQPDVRLSSGGYTLLDELHGNNLRVKQLGSEQASGKGNISLGAKARARTAAELRELMLTIAEVGTELGSSVQTPGVTEPFQMPVTRRYQDLLNSARAFASDLELNRAIFVEHLGEEEVIRLSTLIEEFESGTTRKREGKDERQLSTAALGVASERGLQLVRLLHAIVRMTMRDDPALFATWKRVSRVQSPARRKEQEGKGDGSVIASASEAPKG